MKTLVVYDSVYGNTRTIAQAIGDAIPGEVEVLQAGEVNVSALEAYDLLIVGAPTHGGRPSPGVQAFLDQIEAPALEGINVAAFDTRVTHKLARFLGFAAPQIAKILEKKGGTLVGSPGDFYVTGGEGPLKGGDVERAGAWTKGIARSVTGPTTA